MWTADEIAQLCYEHYAIRLPKQGKPEPNRQWTLLAAVVKIQFSDQACDIPDKPVQGETFSLLPVKDNRIIHYILSRMLAVLGLFL
jgi:hypothetical protein